jgi:hypothetical protein
VRGTRSAFGEAPLSQAERELFPEVPYADYTPTMRFASYARAKEIVFERTGELLPI